MRSAIFYCLFTLLIFTSCGGNSSSSSQTQATEGVAVDPYIVGAQFQEVLADGTPGQLSSFTAEDGRFSFSSPVAADSTILMVVNGFHNGIPFSGILKTDLRLEGNTIIVSPLTTLLTNLMQGGLTASEAKDHIQQSFSLAGLPLLTEDLLTDPMAAVQNSGSYNSLVANISTNAFFQALEKAGEDGYYLTDTSGYLSHLETRHELLTNVVAAIRSSLKKEGRDRIRDNVLTLLGGALPEGTDISDEEIIRSVAAMADYLALRASLDLCADGISDIDLSTLNDEAVLSELALKFFLAENVERDYFVEYYRNMGIYLPPVSAEESFSLDANGSVLTAFCPGNASPKADAGPDLEVSPTWGYPSVSPDGSASYDPDNDAIGYRWSFISTPLGSRATLSNPAEATTSFVPDIEGDYILQLVVTDGKAFSPPSLMTVSALPCSGHGLCF